MRTPLLPWDVARELYAPDWQTRLRALFAENHELCLAVRIASPSLSRELRNWLSGSTVTERAHRRLLAYALRASTRTTPYGLFAAISRVNVGDVTTLELIAELRTRTRVDMGWLAEVTARWREDVEFRKKLRVRVNDALLRRGDRYTAYHPLRTRRIEKSVEYTPMTFTATDEVRFIESVVRAPVSLSDLALTLGEQYGEPPDECFRLLNDLWEAGFFVDELGIDPSKTDSAREVLARVELREPGRATDVKAVVDAIAALDASPVATRCEDDYAAIDTMQLNILEGAKSGGSQTDAARDVTGTLSKEILSDVQRLAQLMMHGPVSKLQEYRKRFEERFEGDTREVPLLELVHPSFGLGSPEDTKTDALPRDLLEQQTLVAAQALREDRLEIAIDPNELGAFMPPLLETRTAASFDIGFEVVGASREALDRGEYLVASSGFTFASRAGAGLGRFADLFDEGSHADLERIASELEALHPDAIVAELVASPTWARGLNVSIRPVKHKHLVRVGLMEEDSSGDVLPLDDLVVGLDGVGFYLRSLRHRKRVVLTESHVLNIAGSAPVIPRLLSLLSRDGWAYPRQYAWDARMPFLPRVRSGRVVLRRASWRFPTETVTKAAAGAFESFVKRWSLPRYVELIDRDNRLLIDTESNLAPMLLQDHIAAEREVVVFEEVLGDSFASWLKERSTGSAYRAEFVASFVRSVVVPRNNPQGDTVAREERLSSPGSDWLYFKIYGDAHDSDRLMGGRVAPAMQTLAERKAIERWYFLRYGDPRHHVRVRLKISSGFHAEVRAAVSDLLETLTREAIVDTTAIATYEREVERYGGPEGMRACEAFFGADTEYVVRFILESTNDPDHRVAFVAQTIVELASDCAEASPIFDPQGFTWERTSLGEADRESARRIKSAIREGRKTPTEMRASLRALLALEPEGRLSRSFASIFDSLVHMHANRCGLSHALERRARTLARQVLQGVEHMRAGR